MILLLDNYDSFTYNIYQYLAQLGCAVVVSRNDAVTITDIANANYSAIVISPGPGTPREAGISIEVIRQFAGKIPILGICLGHQAIAEAFGGSVVAAPQPVHGKTAKIYHNGRGIYQDIPNPFEAGRYHSLMVERSKLPACLSVTAETADKLVMSIQHNYYNVQGVQYHPESILSSHGMQILQNFLAECIKGKALCY